MKIHHIGYLTKNLERTQEEFKKLGFWEESDLIYDMDRKVKIVFMVNGQYHIELIEPLDNTSSFYSLLKKYKNTVYHICYEAADIEEKIKVLRQNGYLLLQEPAPAIAVENKKVVFLLHPDMGIIELLEIGKK